MTENHKQDTASKPFHAEVFSFGSCRYDASSGELLLNYQFDSGPVLTETLIFPHAPWPPEPSRQAAFERAMRVLHLIAGVSYYKAAIPGQVEFQQRTPSKALTEFIRQLYVEGLAEFSFVNQLDVASRFCFEPNDEAEPPGLDLLLPERALVAMGGGKDSLVGLDLLRRAGLDVSPICVGSSELIAETVTAAGLPLLRISRQLAPELRALNEQGALNGHVPVTAINSAILVCAAILYGFRYVVFSNERSADEASLLTDQGVAVNHQYSKSSFFESSFREIIQTIVSPDIEYFSILRPFSELDIVRRFCSLEKFHSMYSSCNRNFHQTGSKITGRWCNDCPKCRFAALSLAVFMSPAQVQAIQGADLLNQPDQVDGFLALCGLGHEKPFECVGEMGESRAAVAALSQRKQWQKHLVIEQLSEKLRDRTVPSMDQLLKASKHHFIPARLLRLLPDDFENAI